MKKVNRRPVAFVLASTNHGSMLVNRHDYRLVGDGGYGVGHQILQSSAFDPEEIDIAIQLLDLRRKHFGDGVVAIDCGANIGAHTLEWASFMHGWGEVLAFEAQERIYYALAGNITLNNCFNARALWAAVGAVDGSIEVPIPDYFKPASFGSLEIRQTATTEFIGQTIDYSPGKTQTTRMMALDSLGLTRLDFVKIDIEGMEMEALDGIRATTDRCKPMFMIEKIKSDERAIQNWLGMAGYKVFPLGINLLAVHTSDPSLNNITIS